MTSAAMDDMRAASYEIAQAIAPSWERRRAKIEEVSSPVREWMVRELASERGDTVLELAAGVGDTGFDAVALVGESGRLISSDFSPAMLDAARRRGRERRIDNVNYRLIDAERIALEDESVDGIICRYAYMLVPDPADALAEARRVLRPGGRLVLAVWGAPQENPFFTTIIASLTRCGHQVPLDPPPAPGIFTLASSEQITALLRAAGFVEARTTGVRVRYVLPDAETYVAVVADTAGPLGLFLQALSDADRTALIADLEEALKGFGNGDGYVLPGLALCAVAQ
jgi:ubiquinone/menaquinone biosynthesis C-methylase UbiE